MTGVDPMERGTAERLRQHHFSSKEAGKEQRWWERGNPTPKTISPIFKFPCVESDLHTGQNCWVFCTIPRAHPIDKAQGGYFGENVMLPCLLLC